MTQTVSLSGISTGSSINALASGLRSTLTCDEAVAAFKKFVEKLGTFASIAEATASWSALHPSTEYLNEEISEKLPFVTRFLQTWAFTESTYKLIQLQRGQDAELASKPIEVIDLALSYAGQVCDMIAWMESLKIINPAVSATLRASLVGAVVSFLSASLQLGDSVYNYSSALKVLTSTLKFVSTSVALYLLFQASASLQMLSLILGTGTLFLSAIPTT